MAGHWIFLRPWDNQPCQQQPYVLFKEMVITT